MDKLDLKKLKELLDSATFRYNIERYFWDKQRKSMGRLLANFRDKGFHPDDPITLTLAEITELAETERARGYKDMADEIFAVTEVEVK